MQCLWWSLWFCFFFSSRRRHTRLQGDWSSDVCSSDLRWTYKYEEAARQGAAGVLIVHETGPAGYPWEVVQNSNTGPREELPPGDAYHPLIQGWLSHEAAGKLYATAGLSRDELSHAAARL